MLESGVELDLLPPSFAEVAQVIGLPAALILVEHYGGTRLWVPQSLEQPWSVTTLIGDEAAQQLVVHCRMERIWVPRCLRALRAVRDAEIRARHAKGEKTDALARAYGLTDRTVWYIVGRNTSKNESQLPLI